MTNNYPQKIKPISVRQLSISFLILIICLALIGFLIYKHQQNKKTTYSKIIIPKIIKHKITSSPDGMESTTFVIPLVK